MKKILGSMKKQKGYTGEGRSNGLRNSIAVPTGDGPEAVIYREVGSFCESGAPGSNNTGDEYLHLPAIVDAAESSPSAATQAAVRIRGYLGKDHYDRGFAQYNAIMLTRILTDNPGRVFTQNFDKEFIATVKKLLREGKDSSVQQILRETLDYFEVKSGENDTLQPLMEMWRKEKGAGARLIPRAGYSTGGVPPASHRPRGLPPPDELAGRIEEARTTARLLVQTVQSTPQHELLANDLVKEFAERARSAAQSIQKYMNAENPRADDDTMLTLIETNEQLNVAMTKHQRAVLQARKAVGIATPSPQPQDNRTGYMTGGEGVYSPPPPAQPPRPQQQRFEQQPSLLPPDTNGMGRPSLRNDNFSPPPGPPPGKPTQNVYSDYQTQPASFDTPASAQYSLPTQPSNYNVPVPATNYQSPQTTAYAAPGPVSTYKPVDNNPFADSTDYDQPQQPQQTAYSLFGRASNQNQQYQSNSAANAYGQPATTNPYSQPQSQSSMPTRPGAYNQGFTTTPSYIHRQDSAAAHATMHGASPPSEAPR